MQTYSLPNANVTLLWDTLPMKITTYEHIQWWPEFQDPQAQLLVVVSGLVLEAGKAGILDLPKKIIISFQQDQWHILSYHLMHYWHLSQSSIDFYPWLVWHSLTHEVVIVLEHCSYKRFGIQDWIFSWPWQLKLVWMKIPRHFDTAPVLRASDCL